MPSLPVLEDLPATYTVERTAAAFAAVHEAERSALAAVGWGAEQTPALRTSNLQGRKRLRELETPAGVFLVRRFTHGGLLRWATGERYLDPERPFREILLSEHLLAHGIRTPRVVAARARRVRPGPGWRLELLTRRVQGASDLGFELARIRRGELPRSERVRLLLALGRLVGELHASDFLHADLNPNNVLVELASLGTPDPRLWILDLDRSRIGAPTDEQRWKNIGRLYRHVERREAERGRSLTRSDYRRFLRGYDPDDTSWRHAWRSIESTRRTHALHRLGWILERRLARPDPRS